MIGGVVDESREWLMIMTLLNEVHNALLTGDATPISGVEAV